VCQPGHVFNQFVIRTRQPAARDPLREHLRKAGVGTEIYYPVPLHLQKCFAAWGGRPGDFPKSERAGASTVALPIFPELTESQIRFVAETITSFDWKRHA
jgi:dTDP-4-amino-4,6-dideoxygalactose transaminase